MSTPQSSPVMQSIQAPSIQPPSIQPPSIQPPSIQPPSIQAQRHAAVIARRALREAAEECALRCPEPEKEGHDEWCSMLTESARRVVEGTGKAVYVQSECERIVETTLAIGRIPLKPEYLLAALEYDSK